MAVPAYQDYTTQEKVSAAIINSQGARDAVSRYYLSKQEVPESLDQLGISAQVKDDTRLALDAKGLLVWGCKNGEGLKPTQLPPASHGTAEQ